MTVIDRVQLYLSHWVGKGELLHDAVVLLNVPGSLLQDLRLTAINLVRYQGPKMF